MTLYLYAVYLIIYLLFLAFKQHIFPFCVGSPSRNICVDLRGSWGWLLNSKPSWCLMIFVVVVRRSAKWSLSQKHETSKNYNGMRQKQYQICKKNSKEMVNMALMHLSSPCITMRASPPEDWLPPISHISIIFCFCFFNVEMLNPWSTTMNMKWMSIWTSMRNVQCHRWDSKLLGCLHTWAPSGSWMACFIPGGKLPGSVFCSSGNPIPLRLLYFIIVYHSYHSIIHLSHSLLVFFYGYHIHLRYKNSDDSIIAKLSQLTMQI